MENCTVDHCSFLYSNCTLKALRTHALQVVTSDLKELGYVFQYSKLDARSYLLPQRRTRVYGTADLDEGQSVKEFRQRMSETLSDLSGGTHFDHGQVFEEGLPKVDLEGNAARLVKEAIEKKVLQNESNDLFVDTSSSHSREVEVSCGGATCVRPTHQIYTVKRERFLSVAELWRCQGLFRGDFERPEAVDMMMQNPKLALDLCGNSFASTCAQAQVIASLCHCKGWKSLSGSPALKALRTHALQVVTSDLKELGYVFQYSKLDARSYLLPQRRTRVYGTADLDEGQSVKEFRQRMSETLSDLSGGTHFDHGQVFEEGLPKVDLEGNAARLVKEAIEKKVLQNESNDLFVDTSSSHSREVEVSCGGATCVRPTHQIYTVKRERFLSVAELWRCQGLFRGDFERPEAVDMMMQNPKLALDLCGNSFASTCAQAQVIASLCHCKGWKSLSGSPVPCEGDASTLPRGVSTNSCTASDSHTPTPTVTPKKRNLHDYAESSGKKTKFPQAPAAPPFEASCRLCFRIASFRYSASTERFLYSNCTQNALRTQAGTVQ